MEQLANILADAMDQVAVGEGLINQGDCQVLSVLRLADHRGESRTAIEVARQLNMTPATMVNRSIGWNGCAHRQPTHQADRPAAKALLGLGVRSRFRPEV